MTEKSIWAIVRDGNILVDQDDDIIQDDKLDVYIT